MVKKIQNEIWWILLCCLGSIPHPPRMPENEGLAPDPWWAIASWGAERWTHSIDFHVSFPFFVPSGCVFDQVFGGCFTFCVGWCLFICPKWLSWSVFRSSSMPMQCLPRNNIAPLHSSSKFFLNPVYLPGLCLVMSKWAMDDHFPY